MPPVEMTRFVSRIYVNCVKCLHVNKCVLGYYIYTEASAPRRPGDTARLVSPMYIPDQSGKDCLTFWYHMHGVNIGMLNVYLRQQNQQDVNIWRQQGNQPDLWYYATVPLNAVQQYQVSSDSGINLVDNKIGFEVSD